MDSIPCPILELPLLSSVHTKSLPDPAFASHSAAGRALRLNLSKKRSGMAGLVSSATTSARTRALATCANRWRWPGLTHLNF